MNTPAPTPPAQTLAAYADVHSVVAIIAAVAVLAAFTLGVLTVRAVW